MEAVDWLDKWLEQEISADSNYSNRMFVKRYQNIIITVDRRDLLL